VNPAEIVVRVPQANRRTFQALPSPARRPRPQGYDGGGGMAEWFKAAVLKTVDGETRPGVRIPLPPPLIKELRQPEPCSDA
jgi:hypothetical protein